MFPPQIHTFHSVPRIQMFPNSSTLLLKLSRRPGDAASLPSAATVNAPRRNAGHLHVVETGDKRGAQQWKKSKPKAASDSCWGARGEGSGDTRLCVKTSACSQLRRGKCRSILGSSCLPEPRRYTKDHSEGKLRTCSAGICCRGYRQVSRAWFHHLA